MDSSGLMARKKGVQNHERAIIHVERGFTTNKTGVCPILLCLFGEFHRTGCD
jgi:hypothetical protein